MNVSMNVPLVAGDVGGSPLGANGKGGEGFGLAVKDAEQQHGQQGKIAGKENRRGADKGGDAEPVDADGETTAPDDKSDAAAGDTNPTGDVLGRILGLSFLAAGDRLPAPIEAGNANAANAGEDAASGELEERIVISTVADLAGAPVEEPSKRVALRVTGMETHFEPVQGAPKLVDAKAELAAGASAIQTAAFADDAPQAGSEAIKTPFAEILQRLDSSRSAKGDADGEAGFGREGQEPGEQGDAQTATTERRSAHRRTDGASNGGSARPWTASADRSETARGPAAGGNGHSTGQIINAQLADRIIGAFADRSSSAAEPAAASQTANGQVLRLTAGGGALKTLSIQLEPQDLGRVDVSMRLIDGRLTVELAASEPSTAATLAGDRHGLRKILEHAGFALDDAAITIVARDPGLAATSPSNAANGDAGAGGQSSARDQSFGDGGDGRRDPNRQSAGEQRRFAHEPGGEEKVSTAGRRGGSVYL